MWPTKSIIEEELNDNQNKIYEKFQKIEENWHNGQTFSFKKEENQNNLNKNLQFKTIIEDNNKTYFIYDEILEINNKPVLLLELHNDDENEVFQQLIYFEQDKVFQKINHLTKEQYFNNFNNNKDIRNQNLLKLIENETTTVIITPFLEFINNINQLQINQYDLNISSIKSSKLRKIIWIILKISIFLIAWTGIGLLSSLLFGPLIFPFLPTFLAGAVISVISGIIVGSIVVLWEKNKNKFKSLLFPNLSLKNYFKNQIKLLLENNKNQEWFLLANNESKLKLFIKSFFKILNINKNKNFHNIRNNLFMDFEANKEKIKIEEFKKIYAEKIEKWNNRWNERVEFSKSLNEKNIKNIKIFFNIIDRNKTKMCHTFFYNDNNLLNEFEKDQVLKDIQNLYENNNFSEEENIVKKSPVNNIKKMVL